MLGVSLIIIAAAIVYMVETYISTYYKMKAGESHDFNRGRCQQQFDILRHDFQQFDTLWAVAQPCKLHTMGIGEPKKRCKDVFAINMAAVFGIHETTRN